MKNYQSVLVTAVLALSSVSTTHASTVRLDGDPNGGALSTVVYTGNDTNPARPTKSGFNNVRLHHEVFELTGGFPEGYYVEDSAGITAGPGCIQQGSTVAICGRGGMPAKVVADLKSGNDTITAVPFITFIDAVFAPDPVMVVNGGAGDDTINGNSNNDQLSGGDGNDTINGLGGNDTMNGGNGNDILNGNSGKDTLNGQAGDDILNGNENDDRILGGPGKDSIDGNSGQDRLFGDSGNDLINSEDSEIDNVSCGFGRDRVKVGKDALIDVVDRNCEDLF